MTALAFIAACLSGGCLAIGVADSVAGREEFANHRKYRAIGWAAVSALFFIAGKLP